jgi:hypothetical protein
MHSSRVQITKLSSIPIRSDLVVVRTAVPTIPTLDQPQPVRGSSRIQASGMPNAPVLEKAVQSMKKRDLEGNNRSLANNFFLLCKMII